MNTFALSPTTFALVYPQNPRHTDLFDSNTYRPSTFQTSDTATRNPDFNRPTNRNTWQLRTPRGAGTRHLQVTSHDALLQSRKYLCRLLPISQAPQTHPLENTTTLENAKMPSLIYAPVHDIHSYWALQMLTAINTGLCTARLRDGSVHVPHHTTPVQYQEEAVYVHI